MKNAVIAVMAAICGYLLLHALGAFEFGSLIDREHRGHYVAARAGAVNASPEYILGAVYNDRDWADVETMRGVALAVDIVNGRQPGKPYRLVTRSTAYTKPLNNADIQRFAGALDTAAVIGPFESVHIPSSRALTQFYGLPLLSPVTVASEKLPSLEPDNFVTVFPPLKLWVKAVLDHMEQHGIKRLFILSPEVGSYGDIFCTELERDSRSRHGFDQVFRLNYQEPLRQQDIERLLRSHVGNQKFDAIFFGGLFEDFAEFSTILKDNSIALPVYGSDSLYAPTLKELPRTFDLCLPKAVWKNEYPDFNSLWRERYGTEPGYHARFGAETVFMLADALEKTGRYDAQGIVDAMRKSLKERRNNPEIAPKIVIDAFPGDNAGASR